jgi:hypothetical protein
MCVRVCACVCLCVCVCVHKCIYVHTVVCVCVYINEYMYMCVLCVCVCVLVLIISAVNALEDWKRIVTQFEPLLKFYLFIGSEKISWKTRAPAYIHKWRRWVSRFGCRNKNCRIMTEIVLSPLFGTKMIAAHTHTHTHTIYTAQKCFFFVGDLSHTRTTYIRMYIHM